jgi:Type IV secretion system proteins
MKIKNSLLAIVLAAGINAPTHAFGFDIVFDPKAVAQAIQQLAQMKQQYDVAKSQYESMIGKRKSSFSPQDLLNFQNMFPQQYNDAMSYGFGDAEQISTDNMVYGIDGVGFSKQAVERRIFEDQRKGLSREQAHWKKAYGESKDNFKVIGGLIEEINTSKDMKTSVDLTAKAAASTAALVAEQNRLFALAQMNKAEQEKLQQQSVEDRFNNSVEYKIPRFSDDMSAQKINKSDGYYSVDGEYIPY